MGYQSMEAYPAGVWNEVLTPDVGFRSVQDLSGAWQQEPTSSSTTPSEASEALEPTKAKLPPEPSAPRVARSFTVTCLPAVDAGEGVMLREWGTFMEAVELRDIDPEDQLGSRQRSWSEGDLPAFRDAMEASEPG